MCIVLVEEGFQFAPAPAPIRAAIARKPWSPSWLDRVLPVMPSPPRRGSERQRAGQYLARVEEAGR